MNSQLAFRTMISESTSRAIPFSAPLGGANMSSDAVRLVSRAPNTGHSHTILIVALLLIPTLSPMSAVNGEARFESDDFGILDELSSVLDEREEMLDSNSVGQIAGPIIEGVSNSVTPVSSSDPLSAIDLAPH